MKLFLKKIKYLKKLIKSRPAFHFQVEWNGLTMRFEEVTGLTKEYDSERFKKGAFAQGQKPMLSKESTIVLKRGIVSSAHGFSELRRRAQSPEKGREELIVRLLDEKNSHVAAWRVTAAYPTKVQSSDLKADGNEVAIETVELAHEGLSLVAE